MTLTTIVGSRKSLYESPLAEEIVVSFEERFLQGTGDPAHLNGRLSGGAGGAGYGSGEGESFEGNSYSF